VTVTRPSRSAALVAACRLLADEQPEADRLIADPFAGLFVDDDALAAARADEALQHVIRLRTRYIDDAVAAFVAGHGDSGAQVVLLGAGLDARAFRLALPTRFFEIDLPATLTYKEATLAMAGVEPRSARTAVAVDLATTPFDRPLLAAGFDRALPTIVVWEGVVNYLDDDAATAVVQTLSGLVAGEAVLVADYVETASYRGDFVSSTKPLAGRLRDGGEPLRHGLRDVHGTLDGAGFDVVDDEAIELLAPRYGRPLRPRVYPARILTAVRRDR
jgi:methyltransferase (TIGR00027 family)